MCACTNNFTVAVAVAIRNQSATGGPHNDDVGDVPPVNIPCVLRTHNLIGDYGGGQDDDDGADHTDDDGGDVPPVNMPCVLCSHNQSGAHTTDMMMMLAIATMMMTAMCLR